MASAMNSVPVIPSPTFAFTPLQSNIIAQTGGVTAPTDITAGGTLPVPPNVQGGTTASTTTAGGNSLSGGSTTGTKEYDGPPTAVPASGVNTEALPPGTDPYTNLLKILNQFMNECKAGQWAGQLSNPNIQNMLKVTGAPTSVVSPNSLWCATSVAYLLKISGLPFQTQSPGGPICCDAGSYRSYGTGVDVAQPHLWRKGDVIVPTRPGGSGMHVAFLWGVANDNVILLGGNQHGGQGTVQGWYAHTVSGTAGYHVVAVRRNWTIPPALDTPLI